MWCILWGGKMSRWIFTAQLTLGLTGVCLCMLRGTKRLQSVCMYVSVFSLHLCIHTFPCVLLQVFLMHCCCVLQPQPQLISCIKNLSLSFSWSLLCQSVFLFLCIHSSFVSVFLFFPQTEEASWWNNPWGKQI